MSKTPKIIVVPIDNRPVTYSFPKMVAEIAGLQVILPPREMLGSSQAPTDLHQLSKWLEKLLQEEKPQALFICLDSLLYGGLTASRRSDDSYEEVLDRVKVIASWKQLAGNQLKIYAQASIMRIPNYNIASEEPEYWSNYGEKIYQWSVLLHKQKQKLLASENELKSIEAMIPDAVRKDFLDRRKRNFRINQHIAKLATSGVIDYLIFSQDDTGQFGLNVAEKEELVAQAKTTNAANIIAYAGADEVVMTMISHWLSSTSSKKPKANIQFSSSFGKAIHSNFEGQTIQDSVNKQCKAAMLEIGSAQADFAVIIHTADKVQGDHISLPGHADMRTLDTKTSVENTLRLIESSNVPIVLCDVAYSNGADPALIDQLLQRKDLVKKLWAYAGWNTTGNTIGSALATGVACWYAKDHNVDFGEHLKRALFVRFADDWAYQTQVRPQLNGKCFSEQLKKLMIPLLDQIKCLLDFDPAVVELNFPWNRTFEAEIRL